MLRKISFILFGLLFLTPQLLFAGTSTISLSPVEIKITGKPGTTSSQDAYVFNQGDSAFLLTCAFGDFWHQNGKSVSSPLGTFQERQAGAWLQCSPNRKLVPARSKEKVQILAAIPKDAQGDYFASVYAEMRAPSELKNPSQSSLQMAGRISTVAMIRAAGTEKVDLDIQEPNITHEKNFQVFNAKLKNNGNIFLRGEGTLVLTDQSMKTITKVNISVPFVLPGVTKEITTNLIQKVPAGNYQAVLSVADDRGGSFVKDFSISVP